MVVSQAGQMSEFYGGYLYYGLCGDGVAIICWLAL